MEAQTLITKQWTKSSIRRDLNKRNGEWVQRDVRAVERSVVELIDEPASSESETYEELVEATLRRIPVERRREFLGLLDSLTPSQRHAKLKRACEYRLSGAEKTALFQAEKSLAQKREQLDSMRAALAPWSVALLESPAPRVNCVNDPDGKVVDGPARDPSLKAAPPTLDYFRRAHTPENEQGKRAWEEGLRVYHEGDRYEEAFGIFRDLRTIDPSSYVIATLQMALCRDAQGLLEETFALETEAYNKAVVPEQKARAASNLTDTCLKLYKLKGGEFLKKALTYSAEALAVPHSPRFYNRLWALARAHQKWPDKGYLSEAFDTLQFAFSLGDDVRADLIRLFFRLQEDVLAGLWLHILENQPALGAQAS